MFKQIHYSSALKPNELASFAGRIADEVQAKGIFPLFCYQGLSGVATGTAISLAYYALTSSDKFGMVYVRKPYERAHSLDKEEWSFGFSLPQNSRLTLVFCDDFISEGETRDRVLAGARHVCDTKLRKYERGRYFTALSDNGNLEEVLIDG